MVPAKRRRTLGKAFLEGFLTNVLNPKVSMFYLAAFPQFIPAGDSAVGWAFLLVSLHAALNIVWFTLMIVFLSGLRSATGNPRVQRWLKAATGAVFIGFGIKLATLRP